MIAGLLGMAGTLASAYGKSKALGNPWAPGRGYLKQLYGYQAQDLQSLHSKDPFGGPGLGYTDQEMAGNIGKGVDQAQTEYKSDLSNLETGAARAGGPAQASGAFFRGKQRAGEDLLARSAETRRENVLANAYQKRQDMYNRLKLTEGILMPNAGLYNAVNQVRGQKAAIPWETAGSMLGTAGAAYGMGGGGGGGSLPGAGTSAGTW